MWLNINSYNIENAWLASDCSLNSTRCLAATSLKRERKHESSVSSTENVLSVTSSVSVHIFYLASFVRFTRRIDFVGLSSVFVSELILLVFNTIHSFFLPPKPLIQCIAIWKRRKNKKKKKLRSILNVFVCVFLSANTKCQLSSSRSSINHITHDFYEWNCFFGALSFSFHVLVFLHSFICYIARFLTTFFHFSVI